MECNNIPSVKKAIGNCLTAVITKVVQQAYSACGRPTRGVTKLNFSKTQTFSCLKGILLVCDIMRELLK